jgi:hypothetical protein
VVVVVQLLHGERFGDRDAELGVVQLEQRAVAVERDGLDRCGVERERGRWLGQARLLRCG